MFNSLSCNISFAVFMGVIVVNNDGSVTKVISGSTNSSSATFSLYELPEYTSDLNLLLPVFTKFMDEASEYLKTVPDVNNAASIRRQFFSLIEMGMVERAAQYLEVQMKLWFFAIQ